MGTDAVTTCGLSRRAVLGGAAGAVFLLAACDSAVTAAPTAAPSTAAPPTTGPLTTGPLTTAATPTATGPAGALVALDSVPVGTGVIAPGPVLVVRPSADQVRAYDALCPHARVTIGLPDAAGTIVCPGHGARFSAADGRKLAGPAPTGLTPVPVRVADGYVVRA